MAVDHLHPQTIVGERYEIGERLRDAGGYTAYAAVDLEAEVAVELWAIDSALYPTPGARQAFVASSLAARSLNHTAIRRVFAAGDHRDQLYLTTQPSTRSLADRLATNEPIEPEEMLRWGEALCSAIDVGLNDGMLHGRLTPAEIVVVGETVRVGGFGVWEHADPRAAERVFAASGKYFAPEVLAGQRPTPSSDIYSVARVLLALACDGAEGPTQVLLANLAARRPEIADALRNGLRDDPLARPRNTVELLDGLRRGLIDETLHEDIGDPRDVDALVAEAAASALPEVRALASSDVTVPDLGPPPATSDPLAHFAHEAERNIAFISMKPAESRTKTPLVAAIDQPDGKVVVRKQEPVKKPPALKLGNYAPPRASSELPVPATGNSAWRYVAIGGIAAVAVAVVAWGVLAQMFDNDTETPAPDATSAVAPPPPREVVPTPPPMPAGPCPPQMTLVDREDMRVCVDRYESPGRAQMPTVKVSLEEAEAACGERAARLCTDEEWVAACRGVNGASYTYGESRRYGVCNDGSADTEEIAAAGSFSSCVSAVGSFDMAGNVAEWVADGLTKGGSARDRHDGRCSTRRRRGARDGGRFDDVGFRCCKTPE